MLVKTDRNKKISYLQNKSDNTRSTSRFTEPRNTEIKKVYLDTV